MVLRIILNLEVELLIVVQFYTKHRLILAHFYQKGSMTTKMCQIHFQPGAPPVRLEPTMGAHDADTLPTSLSRMGTGEG